MDNTSLIWAAYISGAVLTLLSKLARYLYNGHLDGKPVKTSLIEWFFDPSRENAASWVATVGFVWVFGYLFIEHTGAIEGVFGEVFKYFPLSCPVGFLFGFAAEMAAPNFAKWLIGKFSKG